MSHTCQHFEVQREWCSICFSQHHSPVSFVSSFEIERASGTVVMDRDVLVVVKGDNELIMFLTHKHRILLSIHSLVINYYLLLSVATPAQLPLNRRLV